MLICFVFGIGFMIMGILFALGKAMGFVPGWDNMDDEERGAVRIAPLCRNIGSVISLAGFILLIGAFSAAFREYALRWVMIGWLLLSGLDVYFISRSERYKVQKQ